MEPHDKVGPAKQKRRVAKPAACVLLSVTCKRYSSSAITTILSVFLHLKLGYDKDTSTTIYHFYNFLASVFSVVGAMIAESRFGIYRTIVAVSVIYAIGCTIIAFGVVDVLYLPIQVLSVVGLVIIAVADGCITPLISTYGAYQYHSTEVDSIALFFVIYYFAGSVGSIISRLVNPILRHDVQCFGNDDCFPAIFGLSGITATIAAILIAIADHYSATTQTAGSGLHNAFACIAHAAGMKVRSKMSRSISIKDHWLNFSEEKYGKTLVWETRAMFNVIVLYLPMILFWALFFQQGSRWIFQAVRMNGDMGFFTIISDQISVLNPLLVLLLLPLFEKVLNPLLQKLGIVNDLRKVTLGGVLAGAAFLLSAMVEWQLENGKYLHMAWLLPQYTIMVMAEILVTVPMMNFSYTVAPKGMKTMLQSFNNLTKGLGNLVVIVVVKSKVIESQTYEFLLFALLVFVNMILFAFLAKRFKPLEKNAEKGKELF